MNFLEKPEECTNFYRGTMFAYAAMPLYICGVCGTILKKNDAMDVGPFKRATPEIVSRHLNGRD